MNGPVMLSDVAELVMGQSPPSTSYNDAGEGLPFYQGKSEFGATYPTPRKYCTEPKKLAEVGDILMSVRAPVGDTNLCREKSCIGRGIAAIRAKNIDRDFLYFYLRKIEPYIDSLGSGAIFKAINKSQLSELPINEAGIALPEQKKIAHILSTVQRAIEAQERIIQTTTELKKALMQKLFTEGLRNEPQKQTEIGPVPESWDEITLGELCEKPDGALQTGPFGSQLHKSEYQETGVAVVNPTHLAGNRINHEVVPRVGDKVANRLNRHQLQESDILFGRRGEIGRHGLVTKEEAGWLCGTGCFLVRARKSFIDNRFLSYYFSTEPLVNWLYSHAAGAIMPNLNNTVLKKLPVFYPDISTQEQIVEVFETVDGKAATASRKRTTLQDLFRTLLYQLMTAQIRVHDLDLPELAALTTE